MERKLTFSKNLSMVWFPWYSAHRQFLLKLIGKTLNRNKLFSPENGLIPKNRFHDSTKVLLLRLAGKLLYLREVYQALIYSRKYYLWFGLLEILKTRYLGGRQHFSLAGRLGLTCSKKACLRFHWNRIIGDFCLNEQVTTLLFRKWTLSWPIQKSIYGLIYLIFGK